MRLWCSLILVRILFSFPGPISGITIFEMKSTVIDLVENLANVWDLINDKLKIEEKTRNAAEMNQQQLVEENVLRNNFSEDVSKLDPIITQLRQINNKLRRIDEPIGTINRMLEELRNESRLDQILYDIEFKLDIVNEYYRKMTNCLYNHEQYRNCALGPLGFRDFVVLVIPRTMNQLIQREVTNVDFLRMLEERLISDENFCKKQQSTQQWFLRFLNEMILTNAKSYMVIQVAHMLKQVYYQGNVTTEFRNAEVDFVSRTNSLIGAIKSYTEKKSSTQLWMCDSVNHREGETFLQITNFLHGYILNTCYEDPWCETQPSCSNVIGCNNNMNSPMKVCLTNTYETSRRYEYIEYDGGIFGKKKSCQNVHSLETYDEDLQECSFRFCICDEGEKFNSSKFISLRASMVKLEENRVVTGVRFVKRNRMIHLQVQEGKLLGLGRIDINSVRWIPVDDHKITDEFFYKNQDFHILSWEERSFHLADVISSHNSVVTGVRFRVYRSRLHLEILTTPFDFTSGKLSYTSSYYQDDPGLYLKFIKELKLNMPDVPIHGQSDVITTDKYVKLTYTDFLKDAAQTTVPFFDAQNVTSALPVPLSGIGIFHKGRPGSGGFISLRIFTYDFAPYLEFVNVTTRGRH